MSLSPEQPGLQTILDAYPNIFVTREILGNVQVLQRLDHERERVSYLYLVLDPKGKNKPKVGISIGTRNFFGREMIGGYTKLIATPDPDQSAPSTVEVEELQPDIDVETELGVVRQGLEVFDTLLATPFELRGRFNQRAYDRTVPARLPLDAASKGEFPTGSLLFQIAKGALLKDGPRIAQAA